MTPTVTPAVPDEALIAQARDGDRDAFSEIVRRHESRVAATAIGMLGNTVEADDVGQETFIRFHRALDKFRGESSVETYLTRIAINLSLNEIKRRKRWTRLSWSHSGDGETDPGTTVVPEPSVDGAEEMDERERAELVQWAIAGLAPEFRAVVVLRLLNGYSTAETAETLSIPQGTVLSRLSRAQQKLKRTLSPLLEAT